MSKIFIGLIDIASVIEDWKFGFKKLGIDTITASHGHMTPMHRNKVDYDIDKLFPLKFFPGVRPRKLQAYLQDRANPAKNFVFRKALRECDIFVYIFRGFYKDFKDFEIIRDRGKKLVYIFTGGHERWYYAAKQEFDKFAMNPMEINPEYYSTLDYLENSLRIVRNVEKYANCIWSLPEQSQLLFRPYYRFDIPLNVDNYICKSSQKKIPLIIHASSSPIFKGTKYILDTIKKLEKEGVEFEFEMIHNMPHEKALERYKQCDIIVNQLFAPGGGKLAIEGMAMGKVMLTFQGYEYGYDQKVPKDCPIVDVDKQNITDKLRDIIKNVELRQKLAEAGPAYVREHHSAEKCAKTLLDNLDDNNLNPDFTPTFFRNDFIPESAPSIEIYNKWTQHVKNCDWYKQIEPGERAGLIF